MAIDVGTSMRGAFRNSGLTIGPTKFFQSFSLDAKAGGGGGVIGPIVRYELAHNDKYFILQINQAVPWIKFI